jgi:hypothetical protein
VVVQVWYSGREERYIKASVTNGGCWHVMLISFWGKTHVTAEMKLAIDWHVTSRMVKRGESGLLGSGSWLQWPRLSLAYWCC